MNCMNILVDGQLRKIKSVKQMRDGELVELTEAEREAAIKQAEAAGYRFFGEWG